MSDSNNISSRIAKAGAPFKFFGKRESTSSTNSATSKLIPATPKMKINDFSLKPPVTPTLTDASIKGEQKRTGILEAQLKEVSLTASKAYDQVEDLTLRNNMLEDQVLQQKELIESFTKQLEDATKEKNDFNSFKDNVMKEKLEEHNNDSSLINELRENNNTLKSEIDELKSKLKEFEKLVNEKESTNKNLKENHEKEIENNNILIKQLQLDLQNQTPPITPKEQDFQKSSNDIEPIIENNNDININYIDIIKSQKKRIEELENELHSRTKNYENSLNEIKNSVLILNSNQIYLTKNHQHYNTLTNKKTSIKNTTNSDKGDGKTFVLSNLSFLP